MTNSQLRQQGVLNLMEEICKLVELTKNQNKDDIRSMVLFEMASIQQALAGDYSEMSKNLVNLAFAKVREYVSKVYGEDNFSLNILRFNPSTQISAHTLRILEETTDQGVSSHFLPPPLYPLNGTVSYPQVSAGSSDDFAVTIKYCFSVFSFFLYLIICIELYRMRVFKDSIVYSNFVTSKPE